MPVRLFNLKSIFLPGFALIALSSYIAPEAVAQNANTASETMPDIAEVPISEQATWLKNGKTTSEQLVKAYLERIDRLDRKGPALNAVIAVMPDALEQARQRDAEQATGRARGPLHGIPVMVKDNIEVAGPVPTTAGSTALLENITNRDAPMIARLKAAGAIILGKTNLSQWANIRSSNSTSGWSSVGGLVRNPYALDRNSCGSSSGSGAAAAASLAAGTIGTETDGSITCPAAINGLVGFKPTVGLVSRTYIVPISHSQDTAGPMTRTVRDTALMLTAMAGSDPMDKATQDAGQYAVNFTKGLSATYLKNVHIGVMRDRIGSNAAIQAVFNSALKQLEKAGAILVDIQDTRAGLDEVGEAEFAVLMTELRADMNTYLASTPPAVKTRTLADLIAFNKENAGTELRWFGQDLFELAESQAGLDDNDYKAARTKARTLAGPKGIDRLLRANNVRFLVGPTNGPAWVSDIVNGDNFGGPSQSQLPAVAGYPHITVPMGDIEGLPLGLSIIGTKWADHDVIRAGYAFEQASQARKPPMYRQTVKID
ncbi:amidase [Sphingorhabdus sp. Alg239-R122]|uniref:amidase n=1 Tax=Sphingorhabdus sp. Alg239-R122 TaxID=2305989 RepID=UPI0013DD4CDD|nr:amidase [Sphingorhabdus sp. Alg239-R122]